MIEVYHRLARTVFEGDANRAVHTYRRAVAPAETNYACGTASTSLYASQFRSDSKKCRNAPQWGVQQRWMKQ